MRKLTRQTIESNFHVVYARTLYHAIFELFACDVKPTTIERHLFDDLLHWVQKKWNKKSLINYNNKNVNLFY